MPSKYPGDKQVATYVPESVAADIDRVAQSEGLSRAAWMRTTLVKELVARTRAEQGLPAKVEDPATIAKVGAIVGSAARRTASDAA